MDFLFDRAAMSFASSFLFLAKCLVTFAAPMTLHNISYCRFIAQVSIISGLFPFLNSLTGAIPFWKSEKKMSQL